MNLFNLIFGMLRQVMLIYQHTFQNKWPSLRSQSGYIYICSPSFKRLLKIATLLIVINLVC